MKTWMGASALFIIASACATVVWAMTGGEWTLLEVLIGAVFLLAVVARVPFLKGRIPQQVLELSGRMVAAFPFVYAAIAAWVIVTDWSARGYPALWETPVFFVLLVVLPFAVCAALYRLFCLIKELGETPPQSASGWCHRLSGWALLAVVGVGGTQYFTAWAAHNRVSATCFTVFLHSGVFGNRGPGLEAYLDALTEGAPHSLRLPHESEEDDKDWTARHRYAFLARHTEGWNCAPLDEEKYVRWLEKVSAERGWPQAHYLLALRYGYGGFVDGKLRYDTAHNFNFWLRGEEPFPPVGNRHGNGMALDLEKSFALLEQSAQGGFGLAQWVLGEVYATGVWGKDNALTVGVDYEKSTQWLEKFVETGHPPSAHHYNVFYRLGQRYRYGERYGLQPDYARALGYFQREVEVGWQGFDAALELALMYKDGVGVAPSGERARVYLAKAEEELALILEEGEEMLLHLADEGGMAMVRMAMERERSKFEEVRIAVSGG